MPFKVGEPVSDDNPQPVTGSLSTSAGTDTVGGTLPTNFTSLPQTITYNGDGTVNTIAATDGTNTWTQTLSYTSGKLTGISGWVKS